MLHTVTNLRDGPMVTLAQRVTDAGAEIGLRWRAGFCTTSREALRPKVIQSCIHPPCPSEKSHAPVRPANHRDPGLQAQASKDKTGRGKARCPPDIPKHIRRTTDNPAYTLYISPGPAYPLRCLTGETSAPCFCSLSCDTLLIRPTAARLSCLEDARGFARCLC